MKTFNVAKEFSKTPFGRYSTDSPYSAENFRDSILIPLFSENENEKITIDFTGIAMGLGSSFLEEAFGGMVRQGIDANIIKNKLIIKSKLPIYESQIFRFIDEAAQSYRNG
ncbi:MAG: STAS-like domain-containing protein [Cognaticolwellia sp.]